MASDLSHATVVDVQARPAMGPLSPVFFAGQDIDGCDDPMAGVCDVTALASARQSPENWRYSVGYLQLTASATGLLLAAGIEFTLFDTGTDETGTVGMPTTTKASGVETDTNKDGAMIKEGERYCIRALSFHLGRPYYTTDAAPTQKEYGTWLQSYQNRLNDTIPDLLSLEFSFGDESCLPIGGLVRHWPAASEFQGGEAPRTGSSLGLNQLIPLRRRMNSGSRDSSDQITIRLKSGNMAANITADPLSPIPADGVGISVFIPIECQVWGEPKCLTRGAVVVASSADMNSAIATIVRECAAAGIDPSAAIRALMGRG